MNVEALSQVSLAYAQLIIVSGRLLAGTKVIDLRGKSSHFLSFAPTVPYFGKEHLPFGMFAVTVLSTFITLPPLLLILHPNISEAAWLLENQMACTAHIC